MNMNCFITIIGLTLLSQSVFALLNCDGIEFTLKSNVSMVMPAGVCLSDEYGGSLMYICESTTILKQSSYSNKYCGGDPEYSIPVTTIFQTEDVIDYTVTCCSGNQCAFGNQTIYETTDCSDDISSANSSNAISVIGSCLSTPQSSVQYTSCSNKVLSGKVYEHRHCSGNLITTEIVSNGDCDTESGNQFEINCGVAINTCKSVITSSTTKSPTNSPTPTPECVCDSYMADNSSLILPNGNGCTYGCNSCLDNICYCQDKQTCDAWKKIANAFSTILIVVIVAAVVCGLCCIGGIIYCFCAGALCCAAASKSMQKKAEVSFIPIQTQNANDGTIQNVVNP